MMNKKIALLLLSVLFYAQSNGQIVCKDCGQPFECFCEPAKHCDSMIFFIRDTIYISSLSDITRTFGMSFDAFAKQFLLQKEKQDTSKRISSEMVYLNHFIPLLKNEPGFDNKRMISSIFTFDTEGIVKNNAKTSDSVKVKNYDVLFRCGNSLNIDYFITSPHLIDKAINALFLYVDSLNSRERQINGIHFDFTEFQFREKRAMAQFAKSVSLVIDSIGAPSIRGIRLYFSFDDELGGKNKDHLYALSGMADSIFLIKNNGSISGVVTVKDAQNLSVFAKIMNQFHLARFFINDFPTSTDVVFNKNETTKLIHADYAENNWESYFFGFCGIVVFSIVLFILYWSIPAFSYYLNKNRDYLFLLILMVVFETIILLLSMIEAMSREDVLNLNGENKNLLLFLPLVLVFIIPVFKSIGYGKTKP